MWKIVVCLIAVLLFSGCKEKMQLETVSDPLVTPQEKEKMVTVLSMPDNATKQAASTEDNSIYTCDDYVMTLQTVPGGDIQKTLRETTGFSYDNLPIIKTEQENAQRYVCVWSAAGENGDQVSRCVVLDDGNYHYILTLTADARQAGTLAQGQWDEIMRSFRLVKEEDVVSSGS